MSGEVSEELVVDYQKYDFRSVWVGREDVHRFEQAMLERALASLDPRRTLEIGTGFGRLTPQILHEGGDYVGIDFDLGGLRDTRAATLRTGVKNRHAAWLAANAYHLPFATGSFSSVCMVRVHHHLATPAVAVAEIARVLVPGGTALITYSPRSLFRSVVHDVRVALRRPEVSHDRYLLRARGGQVQVRDSPLRQYITSPRQFEQDLQAAGFTVVRAYGGVETSAARLLPLNVGLAGGRVWPTAPVFSTKWVVLQKPGPRSELPLWERIFACPQCGEPTDAMLSGGGLPEHCARCGFLFRWDDGIVDARYVAERSMVETGDSEQPLTESPPSAAAASSPVGAPPGS
jgi:SAM-dependent methyltransferase